MPVKSEKLELIGSDNYQSSQVFIKQEPSCLQIDANKNDIAKKKNCDKNKGRRSRDKGTFSN